MQKNVGDIDAMIRLTFGFTGLAWGISRMSQKDDSMVGPLISFMSALKVAEGIVRVCPLLSVLGLETTQDKIKTVKESQKLFTWKKPPSTRDRDSMDYVKL